MTQLEKFKLIFDLKGYSTTKATAGQAIHGLTCPFDGYPVRPVLRWQKTATAFFAKGRAHPCYFSQYLWFRDE